MANEGPSNVNAGYRLTISVVADGRAFRKRLGLAAPPVLLDLRDLLSLWKSVFDDQVRRLEPFLPPQSYSAFAQTSP